MFELQKIKLQTNFYLLHMINLPKKILQKINVQKKNVQKLKLNTKVNIWQNKKYKKQK